MRSQLAAAVMLSLAALAVPLPSLAQPQSAPATRPAAATRSADVPVKVVVLYSSGVGYFQHAGTVTGDAATQLSFKTDQVNDILKSLVLQDLDNGRISTITYPSLDPVSKTLASFQINIADNPSLHALLNQLRGSKVSLDVGTDKLAGTILGVEMKPMPVGDGDDKKVIERPVLNLVTDTGAIRSIEMAQVQSVQLADPQLQSELTQALTALAQARDKDKKPVTIHFTGQGDRRVSIGYVVETPIWKTSYRLVLPNNPDGKPHLQGWALVENQTDSDWNNVQLSLVSGRPISFIQDLYQPLYIPRPTVQPELYASLTPQTYDEGMRMEEAKITERVAGDAAVAGRPMRRDARENFTRNVPLKSVPAQPGSPAASLGVVAGASTTGGYAMADNLDATVSVASAASAAKLGELFQYTVPSVSLPRQKSAMLPIVTDDIDADRVSIFNQSVLAKHPLNGALLKNTTGKHLLGGPITVFDANAYAGDARIDNLPPGQQRLLSFGVDLQTLVNATHSTNDSRITAAKIVKGTLELTHKQVFSQDYVAENKSDKAKTLVVEHPVRQGWKLLEPAKPMETTDTVHRIKLELPTDKPAKLTVKQELIHGQSVAIFPCDLGQLAAYSQSGEISKEVREVLVKAVQLRQALAETERQINEKQQQHDAITNEQGRIRENMKVVDRQSQYHSRLMTKLNEQESQIEQLRKEQDALRQQMTTRRAELESYLNSTSVG